ALARAVGPGGRLVVSGLVAEQLPAVRAAYPGWRVAETRAEGAWRTLTLVRESLGAPPLRAARGGRGASPPPDRRRPAPPARVPDGARRALPRLRRHGRGARGAPRAPGRAPGRSDHPRHPSPRTRVPARPRARTGAAQGREDGPGDREGDRAWRPPRRAGRLALRHRSGGAGRALAAHRRRRRAAVRAHERAGDRRPARASRAGACAVARAPAD